MLNEKIFKLIKGSDSYRALIEEAKKDRADLQVAGLSGAGRSFVLYGIFEQFFGKYLVLTRTDNDAFAIKNDLNRIAGEDIACNFPSWQVNPYKWKSPPVENIGERLETLYFLQNRDSLIVTASVRAFLEPTVAPDELKQSSLALALNQEISLDDVVEKLANMGYERMPMVEEVGSFAVRGGIIDIFPHTEQNPVRIELFGDFIDSIRAFSVASQRSVEKLERVSLLPRREILISNTELDELIEKLPEADRKILFDKFRFGIDNPGLEWASGYFRKKQTYLGDYLDLSTTLYLLEPSLLQTECGELQEMFTNLYDEEEGNYEALPRPDQIYMGCDEFERILADLPKVSEIGFGKKDRVSVDFHMGEHPIINSRIPLLQKYISESRRNSLRVFLACDNKIQKKRVNDILADDSDFVHVDVLDISEGFTFSEINLSLLTDHQVFTRRFHSHRRARIKEGMALSSYTNLNRGDYVVHVDYGIGRYRGLEELTIDSRRRDCLLITYERDDRLYVPIEEFNRVQKYIGKDGRPKLSTLGGTGWQKTKLRTKQAIAEMAEELLRLYAIRKAKPGYQFSADSTWMNQLEASFPYQETPDQLSAITDIKNDMQTPHPMDRLVCGDVGFGKTEVAIRAAVKAVNDSKQVAILVPTTILAQQHQNTFRERLDGFPVRVEMLSRFKSRKEQKEIIRDLREGKVDIIIGTHRLLSKDVEFRDLGLLVIDEEQRFGVKHKEKIKKIKKLVDVLTMTATPIPRTMQMSLLGARDMSVINTSPRDRLPISTEICEFHPETIKKAILSEVERGGQVYFVHNRVQTIMSIYRYLTKLLPHIRIAVGHGQMPERELEDVMQEFYAHYYDVLLSTSIIESGLDIPRVNTIVINRADHFGLAQLYQLRGRVGRSDRPARSILLIPPLRVLTDTARKRLKALEQHTELGSGFYLAMKDLEIRGAGNLLGAQQHGFIEEVGFDLYLKLLKEAVDEIRGDKTEAQKSVKIDVDFELYFPNDYIAHPQQKVELYQKLAQVDNYEDLNDLKLEAIDRYGPLPTPAENLFGMTELRLLAHRSGIDRLVFKKGILKLIYAEDHLPTKKQVSNLSGKLSDPIEFSAVGEFTITVDLSDIPENNRVQKLKFVLQLLL